MWLFSNDTHAAGLLLQELPEHKSYKADWERIQVLADTVTEQELLKLDCEKMLYRLFNEEKVRLFGPESVEFKCACSRLKIERTLRVLGRAKVEDILQEQDIIQVDCEFCNERYCFDKIDVENILSQEIVVNESATRH